jgi:phosphoribosylformylglycinamidine synthase II/formyltetrahydrofolate-dependent phosphoribosylglycinamide formyltransferase
LSIKIAVLVSGRGSNLEAILNACKAGINVEVAVVASNNPDSYGLKIARKHGIETIAIDHRGLSRKEHDRRMAAALLPYEPDFVVLAGYMRILSTEFLSQFRGDGYFRVINIHPSLLPAFPGKSAYEDAFNYGVKISGITVHLVDEQVDHGSILAQAIFPRLPDDSLESFQTRGLAVEHKIYPDVLAAIAKQGIGSLLMPKPLQEPLCVMVTRSGANNNGTAPLYWICSEKSPSEMLADQNLKAALKEILADPLLEEVWLALPGERHSWTEKFKDKAWFCERQFLPGVTDNLARTVEEALRYNVGNFKVASGEALLFDGSLKLNTKEEVESYCRYRHFHPVTDRFKVHKLGEDDELEFLGFPEVHLPATPEPEVISLELSDQQLEALSKKRTLALTLKEMTAIRSYFEQEPVRNLRQLEGLPIWPTDVELEVIAQTWSEHCKHKIFNAAITDRQPALASTAAASTPTVAERKVKSLYKSYIQAATKKMAEKRDDLLSVFVDNAGVVKWTDDYAVCFKVETHNSPSALEPYGGALTGILGVNRDILGTGLGAKPIANTDVFCFAHPDTPNLPNRPTMLPARSIVQGVRKGVQDGGNKSGIPTVNGAVYFHPGYRAKPLVFCGTVGLLPLEAAGQCAYQKHTVTGDAIIMVGGRVGKDGIHGATFSSEALNIDSPVSAVQIGDPFTQKRVLDFILEARDLGLVSGLTDNGAGGLSSSVGEMAQITGGAVLELDNIPLKYHGLSDYEIVISESQERMTLSSKKIDELKRLAAKHTVELTVVGNFTESGYFKITRKGKVVALLDLHFLHDGAPILELESQWHPSELKENIGADGGDIKTTILKLLAHPNICSREAVIRQYDHEVQGASVIKPLMGPTQKGPCDAAVIRPLPDRPEGLSVSNGLCPQLSEFDPYLMAQSAADEAIRNAVCVGTDPSSISILDNFCWPDPVVAASNADGKRKMAQLLRACEGLYDAVLAYGAPLISGKDSMKNDFDDGVIRLSIPPTLLVSAIGKVPDINKVVTMEFKSPKDKIYLVAAGSATLTASTYLDLRGWSSTKLPTFSAKSAAAAYQTIYQAINRSLVESCHDLSEGGLMVAICESAIGSTLGATIYLDTLRTPNLRLDCALFGEGPGRLLVSVKPENEAAWLALWKEAESSGNADVTAIGEVSASGLKLISGRDETKLTNHELLDAWQATLPFEEEV